MLTEPMPALEDYLNHLLDGIEKGKDGGENVDAIVIYPKTPFSVRKIAEERNIPLFVLEVGPMRWPLYIGSAYLSHYDQLSTDPGECRALYRRFLEEREKSAFPLLTREQILAIFLESSLLPCLRYLRKR